jgi:hypothetical protein
MHGIYCKVGLDAFGTIWELQVRGLVQDLAKSNLTKSSRHQQIGARLLIPCCDLLTRCVVVDADAL